MRHDIDPYAAARIRARVMAEARRLEENRASRSLRVRLRQVLADMWTDITLWLLWPKCPLCRQRTQNIEAHLHLDHAGDAS